MSFQTPITVKDVVENIHKKKYLLPAIQREVVWSTDQIERLYDSLMRDYPVGSFLFWHVERKNTKKYQFYEFMRDYHEKDNANNVKADISDEDDIVGILDGQQRFTSLYIGLRGSYAYRVPRRRWNNPHAFPKRTLYLNLLSPKKNDDKGDMFYDFAFLCEDELNQDNPDVYWFKVSEILNLKEQWEVNDYLINNEITQKPRAQARFASRTLFKLWAVIHESKVVNYYLEKDEKLDKVLNIFIRVNSGGTILSYSDLLLSIAIAQWREKDAREEVTKFVKELNNIGEGFNFDKDLILKSSLVLSDIKDFAFKVDNFDKANMHKIEDEWDQIKQAMRGAVTLISALGYSRETLTAKYVIIPIAYYLKRIGIPNNFDVAQSYSEDRATVHCWIIYSLVKRVFGGSPDSVLRPLREKISQVESGFPLQSIIDEFRGTTKSIIFTEDDIENLLTYTYGQSYTFSILALLYPSLDYRNKFHIDHIHPHSKFTRARLKKLSISEDDIDYYLDNANLLPNLQLLEGVHNQEKNDTDFKIWFDRHYKTQESKNGYMERHYIPSVDLSLKNFREFVEKRRSKLRSKLKEILNVKSE